MLRIEAVAKTYLPPRRLQRFLVRSASVEPVDALRGVSFDVAAGEVVGLVGPNGAGKSTLIKIISTLLEASAGTVAVAGHDVAAEPEVARSRLGLVLADDRSMYWRLTGRQNLQFFAAMQGLTRRDARRRAGELLERFDLASRDRLVFGYSSGMRSRLAVARALLHEPPLLVLDEPTRSLDPVATADIGALLRGAAADGAAVLLSSHRLDEIEALCDRIVVLVNGDTRYIGPPAALSEASGFPAALLELLTTDDAGDGSDRG